MPFISPFAFSSKVTVTLVDTQQGANSYSVSLGTPFSNRVMALGVTFAGVVASAITLVGNSMTKRVVGSGGGSGDAHLWTITDSVNSSGTLAFTGSGAINGFALYSIEGAISEVPTPTSGVATNNTTLTVPALSGVVASFYSNNGASGATWTGLTKDSDYQQSGLEQSQAHGNFTTAQSPLSISVASSGASFRLVAGVWSPT